MFKVTQQLSLSSLDMVQFRVDKFQGGGSCQIQHQTETMHERFKYTN